MSTIAGQGKEWLMETEPVLSKALWLLSLHGGGYVISLEARSLCTYLFILLLKDINAPYKLQISIKQDIL